VEALDGAGARSVKVGIEEMVSAFAEFAATWSREPTVGLAHSAFVRHGIEPIREHARRAGMPADLISR